MAWFERCEWNRFFFRLLLVAAQEVVGRTARANCKRIQSDYCILGSRDPIGLVALVARQLNKVILLTVWLQEASRIENWLDRAMALRRVSTTPARSAARITTSSKPQEYSSTMANESAADTDYLEFDELCKALHRKDPNCTEVAVIWDRERLNINNDVSKWCPVGYGPRLGRALKGNEFVQTIELQRGHLIPSHHADDFKVEDDANGVLEFLRNSASLRSVKLRAGMVGGRWMYDEEILVIKLAFMAAAENPHGPLALHVDLVDLEESYSADVPPDTLANALRATTSEELSIWLGDGSTPGSLFGDEYQYDEDDFLLAYAQHEKEKTAGLALVAQGFRDNCSLKRLHILGASGERSVAAVVDALRHNGSLISVEYRDFTEVQRDRVQSYCARNQGIVDIIAVLSESDTDDVSRPKGDWLPILPTLFVAVQHSPRMSASRILQSLMGLAEELGPSGRSSTKRTRMQG
jgi:hypothetical protein